jgi:hypothetical protein
VTHFNITASSGVTPGFTLAFYEPGKSSSAYTGCCFSSNGTCPVTTPVGGTWSIAVIRNLNSVGKFTTELT